MVIGAKATAAAPAGVLAGATVLRHQVRNSDLAFSHEERRSLRLEGLLPAAIESRAVQLQRVRLQLASLPDDIQRHLLLRDLRERNERLFFQLCRQAPAEFLALVYTPTIGAVCLRYSELWRSPRGLFVTLADLGHVSELFDNLGWPTVKTIVVTDGQRILGLGDLGANGMGIPTGKCDVITAFGGVRPDWVLPVMIDVGTDNEALLSDPLYIGQRTRRDTSPAYDQLVDEFVRTVAARYGRTTLIQFEDFGNRNAFRFLQKYRTQLSVYDDDIQGTAAVVLAGLMAAVSITGQPLREQTFLFFGAGMASIGCAQLLVLALRRTGLTDAEARSRIWMMDSKGLLVTSRPLNEISAEKRLFLQDGPGTRELAEAVNLVKPTALIGASAQHGAFNEAVCRAVAAGAERPIILALSNPTEKAECTAAEAYTWTDGRALFSSGSPFPVFTMPDGSVRIPGQANNCYIFPGTWYPRCHELAHMLRFWSPAARACAFGTAVALAAVTFGLQRITDDMFLAAADALAAYTQNACMGMHRQGMLYPSLSMIINVTTAVAAAVAEVGFAQNLASIPRPAGDLQSLLANAQYNPATDYALSG